MSGTNQLSKQGRCFTCGRFIKRGIFSWIEHLDNCPERTTIVFSPEIKVCKRKNI